MTAQTDHAAIRALISRFLRALDERKFAGDDWARPYCTDDVRIVTPFGPAQGAEARRRTEEALVRFARTQHMTTDLVVDIEAGSGRATASWNALMTHVHHEETLRRRGEGANPVFTVGGYWRAALVRTAGGWRIGQASVEPVWTTGEPPDLPEGVAAPPLPGP
ncbi:nuclear transport factor 2 family protein [Streptomyces sp. NBC_01803]|uniref:nuclear transport factor 2 family protein n=1 Tax=Streptomyces sp. NBC_01803 TaxID=2975946 RepID=UPI002DDA76B6|nr:nuclear transport factor 2 family protein [Streptomyces sp. NBC_01803]WSA43808.1 nuclear transport factor 2 family protein [Streptomyces sp. NBC_01803]